jgi:hypothetical protein
MPLLARFSPLPVCYGSIMNRLNATIEEFAAAGEAARAFQ